jgi:nicotinamidase-related amidase
LQLNDDRELATADNPPIGLYYDAEPAMGKEQFNPAHSANFGQGLAEKLERLGVEHVFVHPGAPSKEHPTMHQYVIGKLRR